MRILSWNTAQGRGTAAALELARELSADAILLQEATSAEVPGGSTAGSVVPGHAWGSWIHLQSGSLEPIALSDDEGWVTGARWLHGSGDCTYLFSLHAPTSTKAQPRRSYVAEARRIVAAICAKVPADARLLIGGDFNFKSFGERLPAESISTLEAERRALAEYRALGLLVAWRDTHPCEPLPQTLRWRKQPATPFHCDGFLTRGVPHASVTCEVLTTESVARSSDHNPVLLTIERTPTRELPSPGLLA